VDADDDDEEVSTVEEFTDPYLGTYTPPPEVQPGVCDVCHGATGYMYDGDPWERCWSCKESVRGVSNPLALVVPISLYRVGEQLHTVLKDYKRSPSERVRNRHLLQAGAILHRFLNGHRDHIAAEAGGYWDTVTIVPSKTNHEDVHPLESAIMLGEPLRDEYMRLLETAEVGRIGRAQSSDRGYSATDDAGGRRVLLVDDTFTSGATFQSAASALALGGAAVVAGLVIGRVIDTSNANHPEKLELWERQRRVPFSFETCCLE
jgi:hypothetical protein